MARERCGTRLLAGRAGDRSDRCSLQCRRRRAAAPQRMHDLTRDSAVPCVHSRRIRAACARAYGLQAMSEPHGEDPVFPPAAAFSEKAHVKSLEDYKAMYARSVEHPQVRATQAARARACTRTGGYRRGSGPHSVRVCARACCVRTLYSVRACVCCLRALFA